MARFNYHIYSIMINSIFKTSILICLFLFGLGQTGNSQSIELVGADVLNGALNGLALGGATMALQNSSDRAPLRVGLGGGILYGIGTGIYDNSKISKGEQYFKSATFNDGKNSTVIVLLDTFYGAAGGAAIGGAISLISNDPVLDGLQYGSGAGAWIGFGFGLIDSFILADGPDDFQASVNTTIKNKAEGIVQLHTANDNLSMGFFNPTLFAQKKVTSHSISPEYSMGMEFVNFNIAL